MSRMNRRDVLTALVPSAMSSLTGCSFVQSERPKTPPTGSLRFENKADLPHSITLQVTAVGNRPGGRPGSVQGNVTARPTQRTLTASYSLAPGEHQTYTSVFTEPVWYAVQFTVDGIKPVNGGGNMTYNPVPPGREGGCFLSGIVSAANEFMWVVTTTKNVGSFTPDGEI